MYLGELNMTIYNSLGILNKYICIPKSCDVMWAPPPKDPHHIISPTHPHQSRQKPPTFLPSLFFFLLSLSCRAQKLLLSSNGFFLVFLYFECLKSQITQNVQHEGCRARRELRLGTLQCPIGRS